MLSLVRVFLVSNQIFYIYIFIFLIFSLFLFCERMTRTEVSGQPMSVESFSLIDPCKYVAAVLTAHA